MSVLKALPTTALAMLAARTQTVASIVGVWPTTLVMGRFAEVGCYFKEHIYHFKCLDLLYALWWWTLTELRHIYISLLKGCQGIHLPKEESAVTFISSIPDWCCMMPEDALNHVLVLHFVLQVLWRCLCTWQSDCLLFLSLSFCLPSCFLHICAPDCEITWLISFVVLL